MAHFPPDHARRACSAAAETPDRVTAPRFFIDEPLAVGTQLPLPEAVAHHAVRVLRLRSADTAVLFNGRGGEFSARLQVNGKSVFAAIESFDAVERESPLAITLIQALVAADKLDWIVEKAVELGTIRIVIAPTQRSVARLHAERSARRLRHWFDVAIAACCQSGRNRLPVIEFNPSFAAALQTTADNPLRLILTPVVHSAPALQAMPSKIAVAVGPEGGFTDDELRQAQGAGFRCVQLGPRILRTESAGLAAIASLQALGGDLATLIR